jgi:hypothetical protein
MFSVQYIVKRAGGERTFYVVLVGTPEVNRPVEVPGEKLRLVLKICLKIMG